MKMWIARSKDYDFSISNLTLFSKEPKLSEELDGFWVCSQYNGDVDVIILPSEMFSEVTFENSPQMVELKLVKE